MSVGIIGTYHSKFGKSESSIYDLLLEAGRGAIKNANISADKIGGIFIGNYSGGGFNHQEHLAPFAINIDPALRFVPSVRVENACASGFAAISAAYSAVKSGEMDYALVVGVEKMTTLDTKGVTDVLAMASYYPDEGAKGMTFPGLFAEFGKGYMQKYGVDEETLGAALRKIASKNYRNALQNPYAQMPRDWSDEDIKNLPPEKNPMIAYPLHLHDCSLVSDGSVAVVITTTDIANRDYGKYVELMDVVQTSDYLQLDKRENYKFTGASKAIEKILKRNNVTIEDVSFAEVHDCFTIAELLSYEALGIANEGEAIKLLNEGYTMADGKFPVNPSGGLKAKGHPVGATGVSMLVATTLQLLGTPIGAKVVDPKMGIILNLGGSAASNYTALLRCIK